MSEKMDLLEFMRDGYLQELNRRFLHPLGLALYVVMHKPDDGSPTIDLDRAPGCGHVEVGVFDARADPEGYVMTDLTDAESLRKAANIDRLWAERAPAREAALGYMVQPIGTTHPPTAAAEAPEGGHGAG